MLYDEELYDHELFSDEDEIMKKSASSDSNYENRIYSTEDNLDNKNNIMYNTNDDDYYNSNDIFNKFLINSSQKEERKQQSISEQEISEIDNNVFRIFKNGRSYSQSTLSSSPSSSSSLLLPMKSTPLSAFITIADNIDNNENDNKRCDQHLEFRKDIDINIDKMRIFL